MALLIRFILLAVLLVATVSAQAETLQMQEREIKAGLLYNFLKYVEWPGEDARPPATAGICLYGDDPFEGALQSMQGRTVNQREITLRVIRDMTEIGACHLLFVHAGEKERWPQLAQALTGKSILTVSDFEGFAQAGGMIEFGRKDDHIHVWLNIDAVKAARLSVQERLLRLVTVVHPTSRADR